VTYPKKLIEVALPLDAINAESAREKSIRHGHPSTLHLWWARRPLAACRAVIFASLVDDPSAHPDRFPTEKVQETERQRLFGIIAKLVKWENSTNQEVLDEARREIMQSTGGNPPPLLDPFCGGGSIPLEAQRLGLEAHGSDLNPVAVLITKALIEIPPKFADRPPVNPAARGKIGAGSGWTGAQGLAEDVRYYGKWMRDEAYKRIAHLYPKVTLPKEHGSGEATVIAWLWARTITCPNPACRARMPLVRSFWLSTKAGKKAWVEPVVDHAARAVSFEVRTGQGEPPEGTVNRRGATCICCGTPVPLDYVRAEGKAGRMAAQLMATVAEVQRGRIYLPPISEHVGVAAQAEPEWVPETELVGKAAVNVPLYGLRTHADLFTPRQLVALTTFSDLADEARERVRRDAVSASMVNDGVPLIECGTGATAYSDAVATYLALATDRVAMSVNSLARWNSVGAKIQHCFGRQALPMIWDFADPNVFYTSTGSWDAAIEMAVNPLDEMNAMHQASITQRDAAAAIGNVKHPLISTDPPYYDNIGYADLSDFFYVWLRRSLSKVYPDLFSTMLVPKEQELVATPYRFNGNKERAQQFFEDGLGQAFAQIRAAAHPGYPVTVYYAFKQAESDEDDTDGASNGASAFVASTGWETMLEGLLKAGFSITGTWPMRTEMSTRMVGRSTNALASSIVLVCRPRLADAPFTTRYGFLRALKRELPEALKKLQHGNIAPVDLAQATIGPGMAVFSRNSKVLEADGTAMRVRTALQLINQTLDEVLSEQEGEFDADTRWALAWFEQFGTQEGPYGTAETLSKAKDTSVAGLAEAGLLVAKAGKVRLLTREELPSNWYPSRAKRLTVWEAMQYLIRTLERDSESGAAALLSHLGAAGEKARDLAYRLYTVCERKGWALEARAYNGLVIAWPHITQLASQQQRPTAQQQPLPDIA
jgi:putative DNA methylase